jgi:hypothetical protein
MTSATRSSAAGLRDLLGPVAPGKMILFSARRWAAAKATRPAPVERAGDDRRSSGVSPVSPMIAPRPRNRSRRSGGCSRRSSGLPPGSGNRAGVREAAAPRRMKAVAYGGAMSYASSGRKKKTAGGPAARCVERRLAPGTRRLGECEIDGLRAFALTVRLRLGR